MNPPTQAVCECGGAGHVTLSIDHGTIAARTQRPEWRGRARQVQTNVPEWVYRSGNTTATEQKHMLDKCQYAVISDH